MPPASRRRSGRDRAARAERASGRGDCQRLPAGAAPPAGRRRAQPRRRSAARRRRGAPQEAAAPGRARRSRKPGPFPVIAARSGCSSSSSRCWRSSFAPARIPRSGGRAGAGRGGRDARAAQGPRPARDRDPDRRAPAPPRRRRLRARRGRAAARTRLRAAPAASRRAASAPAPAAPAPAPAPPRPADHPLLMTDHTFDCMGTDGPAARPRRRDGGRVPRLPRALRRRAEPVPARQRALPPQRDPRDRGARLVAAARPRSPPGCGPPS